MVALCGGCGSSLCLPVCYVHRLDHIRIRPGAPVCGDEHLQARGVGVGAHRPAQLNPADDCGARTGHRPAWTRCCQQWRAAIWLPLHLGHRCGNLEGASGIRGRGRDGLGSTSDTMCQWESASPLHEALAFNGLPSEWLRRNIRRPTRRVKSVW